jgi:hypothetical protein
MGTRGRKELNSDAQPQTTQAHAGRPLVSPSLGQFRLSSPTVARRRPTGGNVANSLAVRHTPVLPNSLDALVFPRAPHLRSFPSITRTEPQTVGLWSSGRGGAKTESRTLRCKHFRQALRLYQQADHTHSHTACSARHVLPNAPFVGVSLRKGRVSPKVERPGHRLVAAVERSRVPWAILSSPAPCHVTKRTRTHRADGHRTHNVK